MTKAELIDKIAQSADVPKAGSGRVLDAALDAVKGALKKGRKITIVGFGTFSVSKRKARKGRNPKTGAAIKIPAMRFRSSLRARD